MKQRIITAVFLIIGLAIAIFALPEAFFKYIMFAILMIAVWEWNKIARLSEQAKILNYAITTCLYVLAFYSIVLKALAFGTIIYYIFALLQILNYEKVENYKIKQLFLEIPASIILSALAATIVSLNSTSHNLLVYVVLIVATADSGAYFVGRFFGKRKLAKKVSPKKTIEGLLGGLIISMICALAFKFMASETSLNALSIILIALFTALSSVIGDLFISVIKRQNNIKDSSQILPGHGGILDRIDGFIPSFPIFYFLAFVLLK